jgi:hypothetical protein
VLTLAVFRIRAICGEARIPKWETHSHAERRFVPLQVGEEQSAVSPTIAAGLIRPQPVENKEKTSRQPDNIWGRPDDF